MTGIEESLRTVSNESTIFNDGFRGVQGFHGTHLKLASPTAETLIAFCSVCLKLIVCMLSSL